jgi:signal transduction histidine kinase
LRFLQERQTRRFFFFLMGVFVLQTGLLGVFGLLQVREFQRFLAGRELGAVSYLLEQEVPPAVVASAWNCTEVTEEGAELLRMTGHTGQTGGLFWLLLEETSAVFLFHLLCAGLLSAAVILAGAALFFCRRERMYEEAERVIAAYARNRFERHLPAGQTGAVYQLFGSIEELAQSLQAKSEMEHRAKLFLRDMISNISHQLKTPLAALGMYMEIIQEEPEQEETVRKFSRKSLQSVERMEQLIQSLLKMARLDTGAIAFEKQKCRARDLVEQAVGDLRERAVREGKEIRTEGAKSAVLCCDPGWTKEAVGNLVKNALDHTEAGGILHVSWEETPGIFRLSVADNGCGIPEEDIHHIFKQFYRSSASCDRQGVGLGLSLAKTIMEGQGGNLSVESSPGEGSVFHMTFLTEL